MFAGDPVVREEGGATDGVCAKPRALSPLHRHAQESPGSTTMNMIAAATVAGGRGGNADQRRLVERLYAGGTNDVPTHFLNPGSTISTRRLDDTDHQALLDQVQPVSLVKSEEGVGLIDVVEHAALIAGRVQMNFALEPAPRAFDHDGASL